MKLIEQINYKIKKSDTVEKLIYVNIALFIVTHLIQTIGYFFKWPLNTVTDFLVLSQSPEVLLQKPWSIITYAFLHQGIFHLIFNLLLLYYFGRMFTTYFPPRRLLTLYFLGAISGGVVYMLSYQFLPVFSEVKSSFLIGSSASVMAIVIAITTHIPSMGVRLFMLGTIKLWQIAAVFILLDLVRMPMGNAGGHLAHLGGAVMGYLYISQLAKGLDLGFWWDKLADAIARLFSSKNNKPLRTVHRSSSKSKPNTVTTHKSMQQKKIDDILDKISKSGYDSLSREEKDFLFNSGNEKKE